MNNLKMLRRSALMGFAIALLGACGKDETEQVRERADAYWKAVLVGDYVTAYSYERVAHEQTANLQSYLTSKGGLRYTSTEVLTVEPGENGQMTVTMRLGYTIPSMIQMRDPVSTEVATRWVKLDGQWYNDPSRK